MPVIAKMLIVMGIVLILAGLIVALSSHLPNGGKLPGDLVIKKENFSFYFPLTTCILISVILSIVLNVIGKK